MNGVFRISEAAILALHAAAYLAAHPDRVCRANEMATALRASEAHLQKVLQRLAHAGLVTAVRGPHGGFHLAAAPDRATLKDVFEAIEGPLSPAACLFKTPVCDGRRCLLGGMVSRVNQEAARYLAKTRLSELTHAFNNTTQKERKRS